ncbi:unnamed protein product, partial [Closterium sp. NIES-53]
AIVPSPPRTRPRASPHAPLLPLLLLRPLLRTPLFCAPLHLPPPVLTPPSTARHITPLRSLPCLLSPSLPPAMTHAVGPASGERPVILHPCLTLTLALTLPLPLTLTRTRSHTRTLTATAPVTPEPNTAPLPFPFPLPLPLRLTPTLTKNPAPPAATVHSASPPSPHGGSDRGGLAAVVLPPSPCLHCQPCRLPLVRCLRVLCRRLVLDAQSGG